MMFNNSKDSEEYQKARQMLVEVNAKIRKLIPPDLKKTNFSQAGYSEVAYGSLDGKAIERVIIILRGFGCEWAQEKEGGCTMCGHLSGSAHGKKIPDKVIKKQFDIAMKKYDFRNYPMLCLYNGGSFLNEKELSRDLRRYMLSTIGANPDIKRLIIESRPDFITTAALDEIDELLPNTVVEIGVGVETRNDLLRDLVLNKGVTAEELAKMGSLFKDRRTRLLAYVLVNPPFLTESEAIADTISSIEFAKEIGAKIVSMEAVSIQHLTAVSFLAEAGYYQTPWIWSLFEIVKNVFHLDIEIRIGGFEFFPIPKEFTSNCNACNEEMIAKIQEFNKHNDLTIIENLTCSNHCDLHWKEDLQKKDERTLPRRIIETLEAIDTDIILQRLKEHAH